MKITLTRPTDFEADAIACRMNVRHGDEDIPRDFFGRSGDTLILVLDLDRRAVRGWPTGQTAHVHMKVCDEGNYDLLDRDGEVIATREGYVPGCVPGKYGDYFIASIGPDGVIEGWRPDARKVAECFSADE